MNELLIALHLLSPPGPTLFETVHNKFERKLIYENALLDPRAYDDFKAFCAQNPGQECHWTGITMYVIESRGAGEFVSFCKNLPAHECPPGPALPHSRIRR